MIAMDVFLWLSLYCMDTVYDQRLLFNPSVPAVVSKGMTDDGTDQKYKIMHVDLYNVVRQPCVCSWVYTKYDQYSSIMCVAGELRVKVFVCRCNAPLFDVQIWSSDAEQTHTPPSNLVMKEQTWPLADDMKTTLVDAKGDVRVLRAV